MERLVDEEEMREFSLDFVAEGEIDPVEMCISDLAIRPSVA